MERYQDYVIKDGKFIGEFEKMYQKFDDPWRQKEEIERSHSRWDTILLLKQQNATSFLEVGSGLGIFSDYIVRNIPMIRQKGIDISQTAVDKAKKAFPKLIFEVGNIVDFDKKKVEWGGVDVIIFSEILWYILDDIKNVIRDIKKTFRGTLIINQTMYKSGQKYGTEYFTDLNGLIKYIELPIVYRAEYNQTDSNSIETCAVFSCK